MKRNTWFSVLAIVLCAVIGLSIFNIAKILNNRNGVDTEYESRIIERDGVEYYPRQDITTVLLMGLDRTGPAVESESYTNFARADVVMVLVFDNTAEQIKVLNLNRDTILPVRILGVNGYPAGTVNQQLALAHTYGKGLNDSCDNTKATVSSYLLDLEIDHYVSVSMDQIAVINDMLGGVEVEVTEDFSLVEPAIPNGKVKLTGEQAEAYVRYRKDVDDQLNLSRMERQKKFLNGLFEAIKVKGQDNPNVILDIYEKISDYVVTDCSVQTITNLVEMFSEYTLTDVLTPKGENVKGTEFMEFLVDSDDLDKIILNLFYSKK